jgi:hypothetical protein
MEKDGLSSHAAQKAAGAAERITTTRPNRAGPVQRVPVPNSAACWGNRKPHKQDMRGKGRLYAAVPTPFQAGALGLMESRKRAVA